MLVFTFEFYISECIPGYHGRQGTDNVFTLHIERNVREFVTVAMTGVMYIQDVKLPALYNR